jgi:hypothetical protein
MSRGRPDWLNTWTAQAAVAAIKPAQIRINGGNGAANPPANRRTTRNIAAKASENDKIKAASW